MHCKSIWLEEPFTNAEAIDMLSTNRITYCSARCLRKCQTADIAAMPSAGVICVARGRTFSTTSGGSLQPTRDSKSPIKWAPNPEKNPVPSLSQHAS
eukprot:11941377-Karenia_brevis.AAC.1